MLTRAPRALLLSAVLALPACNTDAPNPFIPPAGTKPIPADARLLFTSDAYTTVVGAPREVFSARADGGDVQRLTFCNGDEKACDTSEAVSSPDRRRLVMRRAVEDTNRDGRVSEADDAGLVAVDLQRGLEATIVPPAIKVTGVDWSPTSELVLYSGNGEGGLDDLWAVQANGRENRNIVATAGVSERRPRFNRSASAALYERVAADGKAVIWAVSTGTQAVTQGGPAGEPLAGTPYIVGADADGAFSPDARALVFRRLTGTGLPPYGTWDLLTAAFDGTPARVIATGAVYRGAPDWGADGIVFPEFDGAQWRIVVVAPDGSNRRVLVTLATGQRLTSVRWLP
jgi:Tol biopolymer transport system component